LYFVQSILGWFNSSYTVTRKVEMKSDFFVRYSCALSLNQKKIQRSLTGQNEEYLELEKAAKLT
jgi:hypothetical protein